MTEKAYIKGSAFPPLVDGKLRLYSMRLCPYAQRTRIMLAHKKIPYETVNINLTEKPEWFLEKNPLGMVPVLEHDGKIVYESAICNEYLEDIHKQNSVTPTDPYRRARDKMLLEMNSKFTTAYYKALQGLKGEDANSLIEAVHASLVPLEKAIGERGNFYGGDKPSMLDFLLYPHYERIEGIRTGFHADFMPMDKLPKLNAWVSRMQTVPAVKETMFDAQTHIDFYKSYGSGKTDYDIGLQ
ncbi:glutathione S-transferase omega-1-like [Mytilus edulis]